ncbi:MAG TPA: hypothetical protein VLA13_05400, partial [Massilibacterium sp.]|nr:hypothetical protein [Massilibacterium sp.]
SVVDDVSSSFTDSSTSDSVDADASVPVATGSFTLLKMALLRTLQKKEKRLFLFKMKTALLALSL